MRPLCLEAALLTLKYVVSAGGPTFLREPTAPATDEHILVRPEYEPLLTRLLVCEDAISIPPLRTATHAKIQRESSEAPFPRPALRFSRPALRTQEEIPHHLPHQERRMFPHLACWIALWEKPPKTGQPSTSIVPCAFFELAQQLS